MSIIDKPKLIVSFSGHRPDKIGSYKLPNPIYNKVCQETEKLLLELKPTKCISGMALGYDQYAASVCIKLGIPFIAAVPFIGQEKAWPQESQKAYNRLLAKASEIVIVSEGGYSAQKMQIRNEWMTNQADKIIVCWNGDKSGGTYNCIQYIKTTNKKILIIDPKS